jgi:hypothetical protein
VLYSSSRRDKKSRLAAAFIFGGVRGIVQIAQNVRDLNRFATATRKRAWRPKQSPGLF